MIDIETGLLRDPIRGAAGLRELGTELAQSEAPDDLLYATVNKQKQNGHLVSVTRQVVLGDPAAIAQKLESTRPGLKINTSFIERFNLTLRHLVSRLRRKGLTFSKKREYLVWHLQLATAYYHSVRPHGSLRQRLDEPIPTRGSPKLWRARTPIMSAGLTDHIWSMKELLSFRVPRPSQPSQAAFLPIRRQCPGAFLPTSGFIVSARLEKLRPIPSTYRQQAVAG